MEVGFMLASVRRTSVKFSVLPEKFKGSVYAKSVHCYIR